jgi:hypothetical protein
MNYLDSDGVYIYVSIAEPPRDDDDIKYHLDSIIWYKLFMNTNNYKILL